MKEDQTLINPVTSYENGGNRAAIEFRSGELVVMSAPPMHLIPYKDNIFRIREFTDQTMEFILDDSGNPVGMKHTADGNSLVFNRSK